MFTEPAEVNYWLRLYLVGYLISRKFFPSANALMIFCRSSVISSGSWSLSNHLYQLYMSWFILTFHSRWMQDGKNPVVKIVFSVFTLLTKSFLIKFSAVICIFKFSCKNLTKYSLGI